MSDEELKVNRRLFLQHSAMATAMSGALYSVAMKTDALAQNVPQTLGDPVTNLPYPYFQPPN